MTMLGRGNKKPPSFFLSGLKYQSLYIGILKMEEQKHYIMSMCFPTEKEAQNSNKVHHIKITVALIMLL